MKSTGEGSEAVEVKVLGAHGPYPGPGGACSGLLVSWGDTRVLVDCGSGVAGQLAAVCSPAALDAVFLSHLHGDHFSDLLVLRYAVQLGMERGERNRPLTVYAPPEPEEVFRLINYKEVLAAEAVGAGTRLSLGGATVDFLKTCHPVETLAVRIARDGVRVVYSADTAYFHELVEFARGADLFVCEASLQEKDREKAKAGHLTARQAAEIGRDAGVKKLLLTHLWPGYDPDGLLAEAAAVRCEGIELAVVGKVYRVGPGARSPAGN